MLGVAAALTIAQAAQLSMIITNMIFVGRLGPAPLAAAALANQVLLVVVLATFGVLHATTPIAAMAAAAGNRPGVKAVVEQGLWVATASAVPLAVLACFFEPMLVAFGQSPEIAALAQTYARASLIGFLPMSWLMVLRCFGSAVTRTRPLAVIAVLGVGLNVLLSYAFILGGFGAPQFGIAGAGLASGVTQWVMLVLGSWVVRADPSFRPFSVLADRPRFDGGTTRQLLRLGLPTGAVLLADSAVSAAAAVLMGWLGTTELAAHGIVTQIVAALLVVPTGLSIAVAGRVGMAVARHDDGAIVSAATVSVVVMSVVGVAVGVLLALNPSAIAALFIGGAAHTRGRVVEFAMAYARPASVFQFLCSLVIVLAGVLRGLGEARRPLLFGSLGYAISLVCAFLFAFPLGLRGVGIWLGMCTGFALAVVQMTWYLRRRIAALSLAWRR